MSHWVIEHHPDAKPVRWQCAMCEAPAGTPHRNGCKCTLMEGVEIEDTLDAEFVGGDDL
jgi:hypothetical protein